MLIITTACFELRVREKTCGIWKKAVREKGIIKAKKKKEYFFKGAKKEVRNREAIEKLEMSYPCCILVGYLFLVLLLHGEYSKETVMHL